MWADVVVVTDRTTLNSLGTIVYDSNFSDFPSGFSFPGDPFTRGDVTYTSQQNLIVGSGTSYSIGDSQTVMSNNYWTPLTGTISTSTNQYTLFGFDLAVTSGPVTVTVDTNDGSFVYPNLTVGNGDPNFTFEGFEAINGEYFTGFRIDTLGTGYLPGVTNVALGIAGPSTVPEPSALPFAFAALALVILASKLLRKHVQI